MKKEKVLKMLNDNFDKIAKALYPASKAYEILNEIMNDNKDYKKAKAIFLQYWHDKGLICCQENF